MKEAYHKCVINWRLKCYPRLWDACPIGSQWLNMVTLWATTLEGRSFDLSTNDGSSHDFRVQEIQMVQRTEIPRLLCYPDQVITYCELGKPFNHHVCLDLIKSRYLWYATRDGSTLKQAIEGFQRKYRRLLKDWTKSRAA